MGRYVSIAIQPTINYGIRDVKPGYGTGSFRFFGVSGTFTVPPGVSEVRVTALGAGGCGAVNQFTGGCAVWIGGGGGGGGYLVATAAVTPGCVCNVAAGARGGGNSCFGTIIYAYGGCNGSLCCQGAGGTFCACSGSTCIVGRNGNQGIIGLMACGIGNYSCTGASWLCGTGGASGSPVGGGGCGSFPGTSNSDIFNCKGFNGEDTSETDLASKFGNLIRWPGDAILGTSRLATTIGATAAGYPPQCYCVTAFGGGSQVCGCCAGACVVGGFPNPFASAGFGGGSAGCRITCSCGSNAYGYSGGNANFCPGYTSAVGYRGNAGSGYVVVEF